MRVDVHALALATLLLAAFALTACESTPTKGLGAPDADVFRRDIGPGDSSSGDDTGTGNDGGFDGGQDGGETTLQGTGFVEVAQQVTHFNGMTNTSFTVMAGFTAAVTSGACTFVQLDGCRVFECPSAGLMAPHVGGGAVTVSGGQLTAPVMLMPDGANQYTTVSGALAFSPGDLLRIQAQGSVASSIAPFDEVLTAPSDPTLTAPVFPATQALVIHRNIDLTLAWMVGASPNGQLAVTLTGLSSGTTALRFAQCRFPLAAGSATIPSSALEMFPDRSGAISVDALEERVLTPPGFFIELRVQRPVATSNGVSAKGPVDFQ